MLVKILSYAASLVGSGKYKAILFSCIAILVSMGTAIVIGVVVSGKPPAGNSNTEQTNVTTPQQSQPPASHLQGVNRKAAQQAPSSAVQPTQPTQTANSSQTTPAPTNTVTPTDVILHANAATIAAGDSAAFTGSTSDNSKFTWAVSPEAANGLSVTFDQNKDIASNTIAFHVHANQTADTGTYALTLTAMDGGRNVIISKTITITVAA